jgi:hypothetical protein
MIAGGTACAPLPPPKTVYRDSATLIELRMDRGAGEGHSHPAMISSDVMKRVLAGIRVQPNRDPIISLATGEPEVTPAFTALEVQTLAPYLTEALATASPQELVTFYRRVSDPSIGLGVTSGGLFLQDKNLYFILANFRNRPSDVLSQAVLYEVDPVDDPLLSLRAMSFSLSFSSPVPVVHPRYREPWRYVDPGKVLVLNINLLPEVP